MYAKKGIDAVQQHKMLLTGATASLILLAMFLFFQRNADDLLRLPIQWLFVAATPVLVCLVAGGYIKKFELGPDGLKYELPDRRLRDLPVVMPSQETALSSEALTWQNERDVEYERTSRLFLVHVYTPSKSPNQVFDAFIYVVRHKKGTAHPVRTGLTDVKKVEFYFGENWGNQVFTVTNEGNNILGVRTSAFGTFLATCRVTFCDAGKPPVILHGYIDCEMLAESHA